MSKAFLEIPRRENRYRPKYERIRDFREVEVHPDMIDCETLAGRCMDCGVPFCHSYGCPLGNVIPEMNSAVVNGDFESAWNILASTSPFPELTSRVCPALCEAACTSSLVKGAVNIRQMEYFVVEEAFRRGRVKVRRTMARNGVKCAVIGSGPSGLSAANYLNMAGFDVTVFEKNANPGGLLRYGIPDFKLGKNIVERRIELMKREGVVFECGVEPGRDISGEYLKRKFDYIVIACGTPSPRDLAIDGRELEGIHFAVDYLSAQNRVCSGERDSTPITAKDKNVLVIGGGDTGSDCIGTARRQKAKEIVQIELMPEAPATRHSSTPWPEYPYQAKHSASLEEGVTQLFSIGSVSFKGDGSHVVALNAQKLEWSLNESLRPAKFTPVPESGFEIKADLVLLALGFTGVPADSPLVRTFSLECDKRGRIMTDAATMRSLSDPRVYVCGDAANGQSLVVRAAASGRACARSIAETVGS